MGKIKCDIIKDLIPSYVDGVCSDATRECVEEHMESCEGCRRIAALCRENGISGTRQEQAELDGLKKIKKAVQYRGTACCGLVILIQGYVAICSFFSQIYLSRAGIMLLFITSICLVLLSGRGFREKRAPGWLDVAAGALSTVIVFAVCMIYLYWMMAVRDGAERVWGMEIQRTGRFLAGQAGAAQLMLMGLFIWHLTSAVRQGRNCNYLLCLDVTGCCVLAMCKSILHSMFDLQTLISVFGRTVAAAVGIGLLGIAASVLLGRASRKKYGISV